MRAPRVRRAFTLAEVVVAVVVIGIIAVIAVPTLAGYKNQQKALDTETTLASLSTSLNNTNIALGKLGYLQVVKFYPQQLNHLINQIRSAGVNGFKRCSGANYLAADSTAWVSAAPYSGLGITAGSGIQTPLGWVHDSVIKTTTPANTYVELHIDSVSSDNADLLDQAIDGKSDSTNGFLRYQTATGTTTAQKLHLIRYLIVAPAGC